MTFRWRRQFSQPGFPIPCSSPCRLFSPLSILSLFSPGFVRAGDQPRSSPSHRPVLPSAVVAPESVPPHFSPKITFHHFLWSPRYWELPRAASVLPLFPGAGRWLSRGSGGSATRRSREGSRRTAVIRNAASLDELLLILEYSTLQQFSGEPPSADGCSLAVRSRKVEGGKKETFLSLFYSVVFCR